MHTRLFILVTMAGILMVAGFAHAEEPKGLFPLGRSWVGDKHLPRPFGVEVTFYHQEQEYELASMTVNLPDAALAQAADIEFENQTNESDLQVDLWVLPFLNVFGIIGNVDGETTVNLGPPLGDIEVDYDGLVYGGGLTLAAGGERFFGSLSAILTQTDLDTSTSSVEAWILTPRVGVRLKNMAFYVGAMYQATEERHRGQISIPLFGKVSYDVKLEEKDPWNYLAGFTASLGEHWDLTLEGGAWDRKHVMISIGYRF